jgi:hypothetical protein
MVAGLIHDIPTCDELISRIMREADAIILKCGPGHQEHDGSGTMNATASASHGIESRHAWVRLFVSLALMTIGGVGMYGSAVVLPAVQADFSAWCAGMPRCPTP